MISKFELLSFSTNSSTFTTRCDLSVQSCRIRSMVLWPRHLQGTTKYHLNQQYAPQSNYNTLKNVSEAVTHCSMAFDWPGMLATCGAGAVAMPLHLLVEVLFT